MSGSETDEICAVTDVLETAQRLIRDCTEKIVLQRIPSRTRPRPGPHPAQPPKIGP